MLCPDCSGLVLPEDKEDGPHLLALSLRERRTLPDKQAATASPPGSQLEKPVSGLKLFLGWDSSVLAVTRDMGASWNGTRG